MIKVDYICHRCKFDNSPKTILEDMRSERLYPVCQFCGSILDVLSDDK